MENDKNLFLVIKTNKYAGNFERELFAYVFGHKDKDNDDYIDCLSDYFDKFEYELDLTTCEEITNNIDCSRFGRNYSEYYGTYIDSSPIHSSTKCDSIIIAVRKWYSDEIFEIIKQRLNSFCKFAETMDLIHELVIEDVVYCKTFWKEVNKMSKYIQFLDTIFDGDDVKIVQKFYDTEREQYGIYIKLKTNEEIRTLFADEKAATNCLKFFSENVLDCVLTIAATKAGGQENA